MDGLDCRAVPGLRNSKVDTHFFTPCILSAAPLTGSKRGRGVIMFTRRSFLWTSSLATVAASVGATRADAGVLPQNAVPPSIAALTSMKAQGPPITTDERRGRLEKARRLMVEHKIDAADAHGRDLDGLFHRHPVGPQRTSPFNRHPGKRRPHSSSARRSRKSGHESSSQLVRSRMPDVLTWEEDDSPLRARRARPGVARIEERTARSRGDGPLRLHQQRRRRGAGAQADERHAGDRPAAAR